METGDYTCPVCNGKKRLTKHNTQLVQGIDAEKYIDADLVEKYKLYLDCEHCSGTGVVDWISHANGCPVDPTFNSKHDMYEIDIAVAWLKLFGDDDCENFKELMTFVNHHNVTFSDPPLRRIYFEGELSVEDWFDITSFSLAECGYIPNFHDRFLGEYINNCIENQGYMMFLEHIEVMIDTDAIITIDDIKSYLSYMGIDVDDEDCKFDSIKSFLEECYNEDLKMDFEDTIKVIDEIQNHDIFYTSKYFENRGVLLFD